MPEDDMIEDMQFTCPECGAHTFGTRLEDAPTLAGMSLEQVSKTFNEYAEGHCHGTTANGPCHFTWPRSDDSKYFRGTGVFLPRTGVAQAVR